MIHRLIATYLLNLFDLAFTLYFTHLYGTDIEFNPIGRWLLNNKSLLFAWKIVIVGLLLLILHKYAEHKIAQIGSYVLLGSYALLGVYHLTLLIIF